MRSSAQCELLKPVDNIPFAECRPMRRMLARGHYGSKISVSRYIRALNAIAFSYVSDQSISEKFKNICIWQSLSHPWYSIKKRIFIWCHVLRANQGVWNDRDYNQC